MKLFDDHMEFARAVKQISDYVRLCEMGFTTHSLTGSFFHADVPELLEFCRENPEFHITSMVDDGIIVNRYDPNGGVFKLAEGEKDPDYAFDVTPITQMVLSAFFKNRR